MVSKNNKSFSGRGQFSSSSNDKNKYLLVVSILIMFIGIAFLLISSGDDGKDQQSVVVSTSPTIDMVEILVPVVAIQANTALEPGMFRKEKKIRTGVSVKSIKTFEEIQGKFSAKDLLPDQAVLKDQISDKRSSSGFAGEIPAGFRVVTITLDERSRVEGFVRPGARVDVNWLTTIQGRRAIVRIVTNARVASVDGLDENAIQAAQQNGQQVKTVGATASLMVEEKDAMKIQLATSQGQLSLVLRNENAPEIADDKNSVTFIDELLSTGPALPTSLKCDATITMDGPNGTKEKYCMQRDEYGATTLVPLNRK
jgi:Flp pilus assembly protein CpaB